jgi:transcriptional regulator with XRE-family HTH domain
MRKLAHLPEVDESSDRALVAAEIRGHLAKKRIPTYKLSEYLKSEESRGYWQRRVSGEIALDVDDLAKLATLLDVSIPDFFKYETPQPKGPGGSSLLDLDSNQEPTGFMPAPEIRDIADLGAARERKNARVATEVAG